MSSSLLDEIQMEILLRLPAKSISRFRCLSKSFDALFRDPSFIAAHLHRSINDRDPSLFIKYHLNPVPPDDGRPDPVSYYSILSPETLTLTETETPRWNCHPLPFPPHIVYGGHVCGLRTIGSCNGLICLASEFVNYAECEIHIWNPSLEEHLTLPPFSLPCDEMSDQTVAFGFGFDATTDDYKVVKLVSDGGFLDWHDNEVYRLRKGCWEISSEVVPSDLFYINHRHESVNLNGSLHWVGYGYTGDAMRLVLFDLANETVRDAPLPDFPAPYTLRLCALKGHLALFSYHKHHFCDLWVMKVYGDSQSWVKEHALRLDALLPCVVERPLGFTATGRFLLVSEEGQLVSYDPQTERVKDVGIPVIPYNDGSCSVTYYVDSLVSCATESYASERQNTGF